MTKVPLPMPTIRTERGAVSDAYGHARLPAGHAEADVTRVDRVEYGRFRNVYLYITEACQLRCDHCYMGDRLDRALKMPLTAIIETLQTWRRLGGSKLTILGGEPTLHPDFVAAVRAAKELGYEQVITTSNGQAPAAKKLAQMDPSEFAYVQLSVDGGTAASHDSIRGSGTFERVIMTAADLAQRGFDVRFICTVNQRNLDDCLHLLPLADTLGVSLVKFHVFSTIGTGQQFRDMAISPEAWVAFYEHLETVGPDYHTRIWYQPTFARAERLADFADDGYRGCVGRTLDRISIFPDGRAYVCSYLFDTSLNFMQMEAAVPQLNKGPNEMDLFTSASVNASCTECRQPNTCQGGCPAERVVEGSTICEVSSDLHSVCRLWKADVKK